MARTVLKVLAVVFTAVAMSAGMAHLFSLPNKIDLPAREYFLVQQIYRGWNLTAIALLGALLLNTLVALLERRVRERFYLALVAALCILASLVIFFLFTEPANRQTAYWMEIPDNWRVLRAHWEYSHAAGAGLHLLALVAITWCVAGPGASRPHSEQLGL